MNYSELLNILIILGLILVGVWQYFWKGIALWKSARQNQRNWFIALLLLLPANDLGILEIVYLFKFSKEKLTVKEIKTWFKK